MVEVTPAIFTPDYDVLKATVARLASYASWIQIDFSDGTMVPAKTVFQLDQLVKLVQFAPSVSFEAHLMVDNPVKYLKSLTDAGFKRVIAHVEASNPRHFLDEAQIESVEVGLALDGASEIDIIEPFLESIDTVVIMTIEAGSPNGVFLTESLEKIKAIRHHFPDFGIAAEGNIDGGNAKLLVEAGANRLIVASSTFLRDGGRVWT